MSEKETMGAEGSVSRGVLPFCHLGKKDLDSHNRAPPAVLS